MGCDIHAFVEYFVPSEYNPRWNSFSYDQIYLPRNYAMFGAMTAGEVRYNHFDVDGLVEPRGYPKDAGLRTEDHFHYYVSDRDDIGDEGRIIHLKHAADWAKWGSTIKVFRDRQWVDLVKPETVGELKEAYENSSLMRVTDPDAHTPSWLTTTEYVNAVQAANAISNGMSNDGWDAPYWATIDLMKGLEAHTGHESRIVFWYDN